MPQTERDGLERLYCFACESWSPECDHVAAYAPESKIRRAVRTGGEAVVDGWMMGAAWSDRLVFTTEFLRHVQPDFIKRHSFREFSVAFPGRWERYRMVGKGPEPESVLCVRERMEGR